MSQTKTHTPLPSGSHAARVSPLHLTHDCRFSDSASLVSSSCSNSEKMLRGCSPGTLSNTLVPCLQASLGARRVDHCLSHPRQALSPRMRHDVPFLVHRRCSPPPPHPHPRNTHSWPKIWVAETSSTHARPRSASLGQALVGPWVQLQKCWALPTLFNSRTLDHFSALTNVRELRVEYLDIPNFIP